MLMHYRTTCGSPLAKVNAECEINLDNIYPERVVEVTSQRYDGSDVSATLSTDLGGYKSERLKGQVR